MTDASLYKKVLNAVSANIAILDETGVILETNRAWRRFGRKNDLGELGACLHWNYLQICDEAGKAGDEDGARVADGIRQVMRGEVEEFLMRYPCHSPEEKRWFAVRIVAFHEEGKCRVIVSHENITPFVEAQEALEKKERQLQNQAARLEETNIALRVLLEQRGEDKKQLENALAANVERLVLPYLEKLENSSLDDRQKTMVSVVRSNLREILSPFQQRLSALEARLTPQEIEVANLIRKGKSSKEIADLLYLSVAGVDFHRKNLRRKFDLTNTGTNLRSYLLSLEK